MKTTIGIPNPCSEDWNKMTPTDKGAYCGKCQFDVIDFTSKSPEEIRAVLKENAGRRTCGHIAPVQMDMVNTNYHVWENQPVQFFKSKFLYACLMVFGMALFTGCQDNSHDHVVGELEEPMGIVVEDVDTSLATCDSVEFEKNGMLVEGMMEEIESISTD